MTIGWTGAGKAIKAKSKGDGVYMKLVVGSNQVRLVGEPKAVVIGYYENGTQKERLVLPVPQDPEDAVFLAYKAKCEETLKTEMRPSLSVNVIDRTDQAKRRAEGKGTRFHLLEKGNSVFEKVILLYEKVKGADGKPIPPGGARGQDWLIERTGSGPNPRDTKYEVIPIGPTPFTEEEKGVIRRADQDGKNPKPEFKDLPLGERGLIDFDIMYDEVKAKKKIDDLVAQVTGKAASAAVVDAPSVADDDLLGEGSSSESLLDASEPVAAGAPLDEENLF